MEIIAHRRNTIEDLRSTPLNYGVEIDIRSFNQDLVLQHDPFQGGVIFSKWLMHFRHSCLILNVKEEGLEEKILAELNDANVTNYFFLDQSFPFLIKWINQGERKIAIRVSEFESIETAINLHHRADWIWVDYFSKFPLNHSQFSSLKESGFKICAVSPELQGFQPDIYVAKLRNYLASESIILDGVCTKRPDLWE